MRNTRCIVNTSTFVKLDLSVPALYQRAMIGHAILILFLNPVEKLQYIVHLTTMPFEIAFLVSKLIAKQGTKY